MSDKINQLLRARWFDLFILTVVLLSVVLLMVEIFLPVGQKNLKLIYLLNDTITSILVLELILRWIVSPSNKSFLSRHWIEILAVLPLLRIFRFGRLVYLLRLVRLLSLGTIMQRRLRSLSVGLHSKVREYGLIFGFMGFALIFGAVGFSQFEVVSGTSAGGISSNVEAFWKALFSLMSGEYAEYPATLGGKFTLLVLLFFEMSFFAMVTGTVSAVMIEKFKESHMQKIVDARDMKDHVILCGFTPKVPILLQEFRKDSRFRDSDIILVSSQSDMDYLMDEKAPLDTVHFLMEDYTSAEVLRRAGIETARLAMILGEEGQNRSTNDIDARTVLAALTIEKLNKNVHTCAELFHSEFESHLRMGGVDDVYIREQLSAKLFARIGLLQGVMPFFQDVLSVEKGSTMIFVKVPLELVGKSFRDSLHFYSNKEQGIPVAVKTSQGDLHVNPLKLEFHEADELLLISKS